MLSKMFTLSLLTLTYSMSAMMAVEKWNKQFSNKIYSEACALAKTIIQCELNRHESSKGTADVSQTQKIDEVFADLREKKLSQANCFCLALFVAERVLFVHDDLSIETKIKWVALLAGQVNQDRRQNFSDVLLRKAVHSKRVELVRGLLDNGADPLADKEGIGHALHVAQKVGSTEIEAMLKESIKIKSGQ